jgi:hypothetical protein
MIFFMTPVEYQMVTEREKYRAVALFGEGFECPPSFF